MTDFSPVLYFGGSFNPVHNGHARLALECIEQLKPTRFVFAPCCVWPDKRSIDVGNAHRMSMLEAALTELQGEVQCCDTRLEIDPLELARPGRSYTVDTLRHLRSEGGVDHPLWLIGMDSWVSLSKWHRWQQLTEHGSFLVANRPGYTPKIPVEQHQWAAPKVVPVNKLNQLGQIAFIETTPLQISSTDLRLALEAGKSSKYLLPEAVRDYIRANGLYQ